ncbi:hypothetical protein [Myxosarcina sp. GI1(2024)]
MLLIYNFLVQHQITIVLIVLINLSITLLNIYLAIKIWQVREIIKRIDSILVNYENYFRYVLAIAPPVLARGHSNIHLFRHRYKLLQLRLQKIRQILLVLSWSYRVWRKYLRQ